ncbi:uncharacterized protein LOC107763668 [Nicotiana tabacum]|uniref:Uncharacterized protein LOC107763668 n=1 Tax=Nicotiana tabacum TaxID=4097 RepID=A0AC58TGN6_TOBAC
MIQENFIQDSGTQNITLHPLHEEAHLVGMMPGDMGYENTLGNLLTEVEDTEADSGHDFVHSTSNRRNAIEKGKTEQSLTDITYRLNFPQLCSAPIKICEQVSSSQSQQQYPNSTQQQHLRYDFSPSTLQSGHLLPDLNELPLSQELVDTTIIGNASQKGKTKQSLTDITNRLNFPRFSSTPINSCGQASSSYSQAQYPNSMQEHNLRYGLSSSNLQKKHLLPDLNEIPLFQEFEDDNIDADIPGHMQSNVQIHDANEDDDVFEDDEVESWMTNEDWSLLPPEGSSPKFAQLYIYDIENEVENRIHAISHGEMNNQLHAEIVNKLKQMLDDNNVLAKSFKMVRDQFQTDGTSNVRLRLIGKRGSDGRRYNLPTVSEVVSLIVGDFEQTRSDKDIIVESQSGQLQRINELNAAYFGLQYPLLFPYGEDGYQEDIPLNDIDDSTDGRKYVSTLIYTAEFQKRGLPHAYILLFLPNKYPNVGDIDGIISAELPDKKVDPYYYNAVTNFMMHGPCGTARKSSPCMQNGRCTKHFPKKFVSSTTIDEDGYPICRRRDDGRTAKRVGCGRSFQNFSTMPRPVYNTEEVDDSNRLIRDELHYNKRTLAEEHQQLVKNLTDEQKSVYEKIIRDVNEDKGGFFFLYGFGGTGGRTAHSRFMIPLNVTEDSTCNIKQSTPLANLIIKAKLIIWDEAPMMHRYCFEALDKTLRDILRFKDASNLHRLFGGKTVVLGGDFRQILPVIPKGTHLDELKVFLDWILAIDDGIVGTSVEGYLQQRVILTPTLDMVESINEYMISLNQSYERSYLSSDTICSSDNTYSALEHVHTPEFLNTIKCSGVPNHALTLKVGIPVMLLRNIDQSAGLCNGTRLIITKLGNQVIEAKVLAGQMAGQKVFIPRMTLTPSDARIPFKFQRRQFPIIVSFAMTINKSQEQSLSHVGLFLKKPVFTHGQLYVVLSRVTRRKGLKILVCDDDGQITTEATNVVFKEVFRNLV